MVDRPSKFELQTPPLNMKAIELLESQRSRLTVPYEVPDNANPHKNWLLASVIGLVAIAALVSLGIHIASQPMSNDLSEREVPQLETLETHRRFSHLFDQLDAKEANRRYDEALNRTIERGRIGDSIRKIGEDQSNTNVRDSVEHSVNNSLHELVPQFEPHR